LYGLPAGSPISVGAEDEREERLRMSVGRDIVSRAQELDLRFYMPDDILTKVDRVSMANSLEVRVPFLDHKLAELTFRMPVRLKLNHRGHKLILKRIMRRHLPKDVLGHRKQGFALPLETWFRKDLKVYTADRLLSGSSPLSTFVDMDFVKNIVSEHIVGKRKMSGKIWSLLFLDAWLGARK